MRKVFGALLIVFSLLVFCFFAALGLISDHGPYPWQWAALMAAWILPATVLGVYTVSNAGQLPIAYRLIFVAVSLACAGPCVVAFLQEPGPIRLYLPLIAISQALAIAIMAGGSFSTDSARSIAKAPDPAKAAEKHPDERL